MRNKIQRCLFLLMSGIFFIVLPCCKKDPTNNPDNPGSTDNPTPNNPTVGVTTNWDLVDFAFRDLVSVFGLDTVGKTKTLQMSYPFNEGDYMVDNFEPQTKRDTMYANGVYHYTGSDESIPRETPYRVMWTRVPVDEQQNLVRLEYDYGDKDTAPWFRPHVIDIEPGQKGDNKITMAVSGAAGSLMNGFAIITGNNAECDVNTPDYYYLNNPFNVSITANYPKP